MSEPRHAREARAARVREKEAARLEQFKGALVGVAAALHSAALAGMKGIGGVEPTKEDARGLLYGLQELLAETYAAQRPDPEKAHLDALLDYADSQD